MDHRKAVLRQTLQNGSLVVLALIMMSCLVSTMAVFMGGGQQGTDLRSLMILQIAAVPASVVAALGSLLVSKMSDTGGNTLERVRSAVPQWMVLGFLLLNSLVVAGEIAFLIVLNATDQTVTWTAHVPLLSLFTCSLSFCVIFGSARLLDGKPAARTGRW